MTHVSSGRRSAYKAAEDAYAAGDFANVRSLMLPLAESGDRDAEQWIGMLCLNGQGGDADTGQALQWFLRAAGRGLAQAQANAGALLLMGKGVELDVERGIELLVQAAGKGDTHALFNLGVVYSNGQNVPADLEKAASCYRRAAELGHHPSQSRLGYMYAHGSGVPKDRVQAFLWLTLAAQHGIGTALNALESVVEAMSSEEKAEGLSLVERWRARTAATAGPATIVPLPS